MLKIAVLSLLLVSPALADDVYLTLTSQEQNVVREICRIAISNPNLKIEAFYDLAQACLTLHGKIQAAPVVEKPKVEESK